MSDIRKEIKARKLRNSKIAGQAKSSFHTVYSFDKASKERERERIRNQKTTRLWLTFYTTLPNGSKRLKYGNDATSLGAMMEYYLTLPIARQLRAAGIKPYATEQKSTMVVEVNDENHVLLIMMLGGDIVVRNEREQAKFVARDPLFLIAA